MNTMTQPAIVQAAQSETLLQAALRYAALGFSIIPLRGKQPAISSWLPYRNRAASPDIIRRWQQGGLLENIGVVCGPVSKNLVVLDLDGEDGYPTFAATFPQLAETYTVATGGGVGRHVYFRPKTLPPSVRAMNTPIGHVELRGDGYLIVLPPSLHPETHQPYRVSLPHDILQPADLLAVVAWVEAFRPKPVPTVWQPPHLPPSGGTTSLNPRVLEALAEYFRAKGYGVHGEWLHGPCVYPERHRHGDQNPSFGFNTLTGYGHCFVCGTLLAKDLCAQVGVNPAALGGLFESTPRPRPTRPSSQPQPTPSVIPTIPDQPAALPPPSFPPPPPVPPRDPGQASAPRWLETYVEWASAAVEWASAAGNQTPVIFHQAAGLWLLSLAIGRRLFGEAPWGSKIFPNLYLMFVAGTTYYRKSTAYKLAERIAREAIPHMLMPTPGSPERFQEALAGQLPSNFDKLTPTQQARLRQALPFASQRGLLKDEVAGLFGTINKRDYMVGMKDLLMELYDCPDYSDKETQAGVTIVENAALSILGVTTPAGLSTAVSDADWANGLLVRFALLTPEPDYTERQPAATFPQPPALLVEGLRRLHERLPPPQQTEHGLTPPIALEMQVQCWPECQAYSERLRRHCAPDQDTELDERLKGVYGRLHIQAFKLATLVAALDWIETDVAVPTLTATHWQMGETLAETWRLSAHRLLTQMDRGGEAITERRLQDALLNAIRRAGEDGSNLRTLYRALHLTAQRARQLAQDLVRAGLVVEQRLDGAEWYVATEHIH